MISCLNHKKRKFTNKTIIKTMNTINYRDKSASLLLLEYSQYLAKYLQANLFVVSNDRHQHPTTCGLPVKMSGKMDWLVSVFRKESCLTAAVPLATEVAEST